MSGTVVGVSLRLNFPLSALNSFFKNGFSIDEVMGC
jgi:hypothetical protein